MPRYTWFVAARSESLGMHQPLARTIDGAAVVLFRDSDGRATALEDRCPHKNVALSLGRVQLGELQCRYHGWRFSADGLLKDVPCHSPDERLPRCRIPGYQVCEQDGWIWIRDAASPGAAVPPSHRRDARHYWFEFEYVVEAPFDLILENGLDCSHTGFAHEGLFRSAPTQYVTTHLEETPTGVRSTMIDEQGTASSDLRSRLARRQTIHHSDEIILPHTLKVDYRVGRRHLVTVLICTPEDETRTRVYNRTGVDYGLWTPMVGRYIERLARKVVAQDVEILNSQGECLRRFGRRDFRPVVADQPAVWLQTALRHAPTPRESLRSPKALVYKL
jgi:phenylpropionate dioxygenase-like ring-hydroxylating dioxygenase large terminal subunit